MGIHLGQQRRNASIYLTFKVIQLIKRLRRRVSGPATRQSALKSCFGLESKALKGLGKIRSHRGDQVKLHLNRVRRNRKIGRPFLTLDTSDQHKSQSESIFRALDSDSIINSPDNVLSAICADDKLFLQSEIPSLQRYSLNDIILALILVHEVINALYAARNHGYDDRFLITHGDEIGLSIDERFIANYEHLLLRLQSQLIEALSHKVIEALLLNDLDKTQRKLLGWFSEYPGNHRPLNTTWPWSIKPSLAVLWGVCWMFYEPGQQNNRVARLLSDERLRGWNTPQPDEYLYFGRRQLIGIGQQPQSSAVQAPPSRDNSYVHGGGEGGQFWPNHSLTNQARSLAQPQGHVPEHQGGLGLGSGTRRYNYAEAFPQNGPRGIGNYSIPGFSGIATPPPALVAFPQQLENDLAGSWPWNAQHDLPRSDHSSLINPSIHVTVTDGSTQPPLEYTYPEQFDPPFGGPSYQMGSSYQLPPDSSPSHTENMIIRPQRTPSSISISERETPNNMDARTPQGNRKPSNASSRGQPQPSEDGNGSLQDGDEPDPPQRRNRSKPFKRSEAPPMNDNNKMCCKFPDCEETFDRKCEWSKHMDKHERPYKCTESGCEKLQGFTYGGGLARHLREVHKKNGGTNKELFCPMLNCKRSTGSGFTRKENLAEHLRRVHQVKGTSTTAGNTVASPDSQGHTTEHSHGLASPYQETLDLHEDTHHSSKRKRPSDASLFERDETDLRAEVKRLRRENEEIRTEKEKTDASVRTEKEKTDARIRQLEEAVQQLSSQSRGQSL